MADVVLVSMPFAQILAPSLGLSLLQAGLAERGIASRILYFNLRFGERLGTRLYASIAEGPHPPLSALAGEWVFSGALSARTPADDEDYLREVLAARDPEDGTPGASPAQVRGILHARALVSAFLDECVEEVLAARPRLVGFTSVFQQHAASLALARRIKQRRPETFVVIGGANCEDRMGAETVRRFGFVDAAVSGEADLVFPDLVRQALAGEPVADVPGVWTRAGLDRGLERQVPFAAPMVRKLDELPYPDYADYFAAFARTRLGRRWRPSLFFETSRGCWWGEKAHCTFCGLNGATMTFRAKSSDRALAELLHLHRRWPDSPLLAVDNILDMGYFKDLLPELARRRLPLGLFYETKSNLRKDQVRLLRDAGVRQIQPGIESFSDVVLRLMEKGVTGLMNVQLLKSCEELGVTPLYNLLWGFPGEPPEEYARMAARAPLLAHLEAPIAAYSLRLDRFSPNFNRAEALGFTGLRPIPAYRHIYRLDPDALGNLAYYFEYAYREPRDVRSYTKSLGQAIARWQSAREASTLFQVDTGEHLWIWDLRPAARRHLVRLEGLERTLYAACESARPLAQLVASLAASAAASGGAGGAATAATPGSPAASPSSPEAIEARLAGLVDAGLMIRDGDRFLSLAIGLGEYAPPPLARARFRALVRSWGRPVAGARVIPLERLAEDAGSLRAASPPGRSQRRYERGAARPLLPGAFAVNDRGELVVHGRKRR